MDWTPIVVAGIVALPPTILAIRAEKKLMDIHLTMNSRLDQLVKAAEAVGAQKERDSHSIIVPGVPRLGKEES
jgi:hypothetical protein